MFLVPVDIGDIDLPVRQVQARDNGSMEIVMRLVERILGAKEDRHGQALLQLPMNRLDQLSVALIVLIRNLVVGQFSRQ